MKISKRIVTAAVVAVFGIGSVSYGHDHSSLSPKAQSQIPMVLRSSESNPDLARSSKSSPYLAHPSVNKVGLSPKAASLQTLVVAGSSKSDPDLAHTRSTLSPRGRAMLGERAEQFEIAPVK
jgi:hypothetical protein